MNADGGKSGIRNYLARLVYQSLARNVSDVSHQYDRIDPAEMQALKDEIERLKSQKEATSAEQEERISSHVQRVRNIGKLGWI